MADVRSELDRFEREAPARRRRAGQAPRTMFPRGPAVEREVRRMEVESIRPVAFAPIVRPPRGRRVPGEFIRIPPPPGKTLSELEEYERAPLRRAPSAMDDRGLYAGELLERARAFLRREPKTVEDAERQIAAMRSQIARLREDVSKDETLIRELEARIVRLARAFEISPMMAPGRVTVMAAV